MIYWKQNSIITISCKSTIETIICPIFNKNHFFEAVKEFKSLNTVYFNKNLIEKDILIEHFISESIINTFPKSNIRTKISFGKKFNKKANLEFLITFEIMIVMTVYCLS